MRHPEPQHPGCLRAPARPHAGHAGPSRPTQDPESRARAASAEGSGSGAGWGRGGAATWAAAAPREKTRRPSRAQGTRLAAGGPSGVRSSRPASTRVALSSAAPDVAREGGGRAASRSGPAASAGVPQPSPV